MAERPEVDLPRKKEQKPILTLHSVGSDQKEYFYPASTVKLPLAFMSLERINEIKKEIIIQELINYKKKLNVLSF